MRELREMMTFGVSTCLVSAMLLLLFTTTAAAAALHTDDDATKISSSSSNVSASWTGDSGSLLKHMKMAIDSDDAKELRTDAVRDWLGMLANNDQRLSSALSSASSFRNSILSRFINQVTDRPALCDLLNGTCVDPENCAILGLTLGFNYGRRGSPASTGYFACNDTTICCYPFLLNNGHNDNKDHYNKDDTTDDDSSDDHHHHGGGYGYGHYNKDSSSSSSSSDTDDDDNTDDTSDSDDSNGTDDSSDDKKGYHHHGHGYGYGHYNKDSSSDSDDDTDNDDTDDISDSDYSDDSDQDKTKKKHRHHHHGGGYNDNHNHGGGYNDDHNHGGYNNNHDHGGYNDDHNHGGYNDDHGGYNDNGYDDREHYRQLRRTRRRHRPPMRRWRGHYYKDARRRLRPPRSSYLRNSMTDSPDYFVARYSADVHDGVVNYTARCERRGGTCTLAADCATNSAVELTGTGSRFSSHFARHGDSENKDQIRSFLCNVTTICCLPQPPLTGGVASSVSSASQQLGDGASFKSVMCALINTTNCYRSYTASLPSTPAPSAVTQPTLSPR